MSFQRRKSPSRCDGKPIGTAMGAALVNDKTKAGRKAAERRFGFTFTNQEWVNSRAGKFERGKKREQRAAWRVVLKAVFLEMLSSVERASIADRAIGWRELMNSRPDMKAEAIRRTQQLLKRAS